MSLILYETDEMGYEIPICKECGEHDTLENIPEHDDYEMER